MNIKTKFLIPILFILILLLAGCSKKRESVTKPAKEKELKIGIAFDSFIIERWQRDRDILISKANEAGATVFVQSANGDKKKQISQLKYFIKQNVDVLIIVSVESEGLSDIISEAKKNNIIVIAYDRLIKNSNLDLYITFNNTMVGEQMATSLVKSGHDIKNVIMINGSTMDANVNKIENGFLKVARKNNMNIIDRYYCEGWNAEYAETYMENNQDKVLKADAIMCGNDNIASVVIRSLSKMQLAGNILVTGQDADLEGCQHIVEDVQLVTVYKPLKKIAETAVNSALSLYNEEEIDFELFQNGDYSVRKVNIDTVPITKDNIDEILLQSGFQNREDVYFNIQQ